MRIAICLAVTLAGFQAPADDTSKPPKVSNPDLQKALDRLRAPGEDAPIPFSPKNKRAKGVDKRLDAMAHFMHGRVLERRREFEKAYAAYKKAVEIDPKQAEVYRVLVPLALRLKKPDADKLVAAAIKIDANDFDLLRTLGAYMVDRRQIQDALKLFEKALKAPSLRKLSPAYVIVHRDLTLLYTITGRNSKAADSYEVIFDAVRNPRKYNINLLLRARLLSSRLSTYEHMGKVFLENERYELAIKAFNAAAADGRGKKDMLAFNLAKVYVKTKDYGKALPQLQKYFDAKSRSAGREPYELLQQVLKAQKKSNELTGRLAKLLENDRRNRELQLFLAEQYIAAKRYDDAEKLYQSAVESASARRAHLGLAGLHRVRNQAEKYFDAIVKAVPSDLNLSSLGDELEKLDKNKKFRKQVLEAGKKRGEFDVEQAYLIGRMASATDDGKTATKFFRIAVEKAKGKQLGEVYMGLGGQLLVDRNYEEAAKVFREASELPVLSGQRVTFLYRLTTPLALDGKTGEALKKLNEARKLIPRNPLLEFQEGWIYARAHQFAKAEKKLLEVIKNFGGDKNIVRRAKLQLSNVYVEQGKKREGEKILEEMLEADPDDIGINNDLGYLYAEHGVKLNKAEKMIRKAVDAEPENGAYLDSLGWVLYRLGKHKEALEWLLKASKTDAGQDATIHDHLADVYAALGKNGKAKEHYETALKLAKKSKPPEKKLIEKIEAKLAKLK